MGRIPKTSDGGLVKHSEKVHGSIAKTTWFSSSTKIQEIREKGSMEGI